LKTARADVAKIIADKMASESPAELAKAVAAYLLETGRTGELESLMRDVIETRVDQGIVEARALSATELSQSDAKLVENKVRALYRSAKKIIINQVISESVVGGVVVKFPEAQLDLSVRGKLNQLKQLISAQGV
jgi:F0F1-type ATP synthase delta subunit